MVFHMPGTSINVANEFIRLASECGRSFTPMQLQKLVYIAHGWRLALTGEALTTDDLQAWDFGPVYPALYDELRQYGRAPVDKQIETLETMFSWLEGKISRNSDLTETDKQIIQQVFKVYGEFPAFKLSALTHEADTPWSQAYVQNANRPIPNPSIEQHFKQLASSRLGSKA